ncbi:MAG: DUF5990 family protein [Armatimonadota bacterium]
MTETFHPIRLRLVCGPLPARDFDCWRDVRLGIQIGKEVFPGEAGPDGALTFECEASVSPRGREGAPLFRGKAVHGTPEARFLYLSWSAHVRRGDGRYGGREMFRRIKIHLSPVTPEQAEEALRTGGLLEARLSGVGKDGTPACASVPLLDGGWAVRPA